MASKNVLICPLDWGLGHATRCIPVIREFIDQGANVIIAADKGPYNLLNEEFPNLQLIRFAGYDITYSKSSNMIGNMILSTPRIIKGIKEENKIIQTLIEDHSIDIVFSDNRFGLHSKNAYSIFMTHQTMIKTPFAESLLQKTNASYIEKYNECWIPDLAGEKNLSGDLSHKYKLKIPSHFIGPQTRFQSTNTSVDKEHDLAIIISGPEPQRTIFEELVISQLNNGNLKGVFFRGLPGNSDTIEIPGFQVHNHIDSPTFFQEVAKSEIVLCRPGYSTIMDMSAIGARCIFVPTPGQTEQEYLSSYFGTKGYATSMSQSDFDLSLLMEKSRLCKPLPQNNAEKSPLQEHVSRILA